MKTWKPWIVALALWILWIFVYALANAEVRVSISGGEKIESTGNIQVKIPFDQEYRINLDNRDSNRRALVHIKIDGRAATGDGLILRKGESVQLERFIDNNDLRRGPKFRFVDTDEQKRLGRSTSKEDGLIAVTVQYEKDKEPLVKYDERRSRSTADLSLDCIAYPGTGTCLRFGNIFTGNTSATVSGPIMDFSGATIPGPTLEPGITIEGSESKQRFQKTETGELEDRIETLVIRLLGYYKEKPLLMRSR